MPECAKTHLQQSRISNFPGRTPVPPSSRGGEGRGREEREGKRIEKLVVVVVYVYQKVLTV